MCSPMTYQLQDGEVLLPPEVFSYVWAQSRQAIVSVHQHMYEAVCHRWEECYSTQTHDVKCTSSRTYRSSNHSLILRGSFCVMRLKVVMNRASRHRTIHTDHDCWCRIVMACRGNLVLDVESEPRWRLVIPHMGLHKVFSFISGYIAMVEREVEEEHWMGDGEWPLGIWRRHT
jgi:hypothetical protein